MESSKLKINYFWQTYVKAVPVLLWHILINK
jgi:hypothetical protein